MGPLAKKIHRKFTYEDYKTWPDEERWEIIDGEAWDMSPAPSLKHQIVLFNLSTTFGNFFKGKPCQPFFAPTDVVLDETNIVQPDLLVVCDKNKMTPANIQGAPDLVVEILSPSTSLKDRKIKKALYERFGVREYLLIHPEDEVVDRFSLVDGKYGIGDVFGWEETVRLHAFPELELNLWEVFGKEPGNPDSSDERR
jgi:Uma2 family endonuclease